METNYKITIAGTGYVGLSLAVLLAQHNSVTAIDIIPEKVEMINNRKSPIRDTEIDDYLSNKSLNLTATLDSKTAYENADFVIVTTPILSLISISLWIWSFPKIKISPQSFRISFSMQLIVVDFPAPFSPISPIITPRGTVKLKPSSIKSP